jgi:hypothetical protein
MIYEYRRYDVMPGRKPDLDARFANLTVPLWERNGLRPVGIFDAEIGTTNEVHYLLAWESFDDRQEGWARMLGDPDWVTGRAESEQNGPLVARVHNQIWRPTPYSPLS